MGYKRGMVDDHASLFDVLQQQLVIIPRTVSSEVCRVRLRAERLSLRKLLEHPDERHRHAQQPEFEVLHQT